MVSSKPEAVLPDAPVSAGEAGEAGEAGDDAGIGCVVFSGLDGGCDGSAAKVSVASRQAGRARAIRRANLTAGSP